MDKDLDKIIRSNANIYLYGASGGGLRALFNLISMNVEKERIFFIDSNPLKMGKSHGERPILNNDEFHKLDKNSFILITSTVHYEIEKSLKNKGFLNFFYKKELIFSEKIYEKFTKEFISILNVIKSRANLDFDELYTLYTSLKATKNIKGSIAEVERIRDLLFCWALFLIVKNYFYLIHMSLRENERTAEGEPSQGWLSNTSKDYVKILYWVGTKFLSFLVKGLFPKSTEIKGN